MEADLIVTARYILTMETQIPLIDHALVIFQNRIVAILPQHLAQSEYNAANVIHKHDACLLPGLTNMHTHLGMTFLRGFADDHNLSDWLNHFIWPTEGKFVGEDFVRDGTLLGLAEMIRSGTTNTNDMYFFPQSVRTAIATAGIRCTVGLVVMDFPTPYASGSDEYLAKAQRIVEAPSDSLLRYAIAPHAPYTVSDQVFTRVKEFATQHAIPVHVHLHETSAEVVDSTNGTASMSCHRSDARCSPLTNLNRLGLVDSSLIAAHMTQLTDDEIALCSSAQVNVVHCPSSNLKLASGFCPVSKLLNAGVNACIGTDSTASNNTLDMWSEMRLAALLAKGVAADPTAVPAYTALRMATINAAVALGIQNVSGSLAVGKSADFISVSLNNIESTPLFDVMSHLVYVADRHCVTDVWVAGRQLMKNRVLLTLDEEAIITQAREWQVKLQQHRSGM